MKKKNKFIKLDEQTVKAKEEELKEVALKLKNEKKRFTKKDFLNNISDTIRFLLEKQNLSYRELREAIKRVYEINISEATLRAFAINVLGIRKAPPKKEKTTTNNEQSSNFNNKFS